MKKKICSECKENKYLKEFYTCGKQPNTGTQKYHGRCKECFPKVVYRQFCEKLRSIGIVFECVRCGYDVDKVALDFHHIDDKTKDFAISDMISLSLKRILKEIKKCILVCSNCHRLYHAGLINFSVLLSSNWQDSGL